MKFPVIGLLTLLLSIIALGQNMSSTIIWSPELPNADRIISNGLPIKILNFEKVSLCISLREERLGTDQVYYDKFVMYAMVINQSDRRVEIQPEDFSVEVLKPKNRVLNRETASHLSGTIRKWSNVKGALGQVAANTQTTQSSTSTYGHGTVTDNRGGFGTYSGTSSSTTTAPDYQARDRAAAEAEVLNRSARQAAGDLMALELTANTVFPQKTHSGILIFDRDKKCEEVVVRVKFEGKIIEFPFSWQRR